MLESLSGTVHTAPEQQKTLNGALRVGRLRNTVSRPHLDQAHLHYVSEIGQSHSRRQQQLVRTRVAFRRFLGKVASSIWIDRELEELVRAADVANQQIGPTLIAAKQSICFAAQLDGSAESVTILESN